MTEHSETPSTGQGDAEKIKRLTEEMWDDFGNVVERYRLMVPERAAVDGHPDLGLKDNTEAIRLALGYLYHLKMPRLPSTSSRNDPTGEERAHDDLITAILARASDAFCVDVAPYIFEVSQIMAARDLVHRHQVTATRDEAALAADILFPRLWLERGPEDLQEDDAIADMHPEKKKFLNQPLYKRTPEHAEVERLRMTNSYKTGFRQELRHKGEEARTEILQCVTGFLGPRWQG
ncbi:unnamed protein product [Amoebophrya sp. A25]|nr:unnamed protein product [Amoebophrya sp. A25]|eukprot:GSA25T00004898001.1